MGRRLPTARGPHLRLHTRLFVAFTLASLVAVLLALGTAAILLRVLAERGTTAELARAATRLAVAYGETPSRDPQLLAITRAGLELERVDLLFIDDAGNVQQARFGGPRPEEAQGDGGGPGAGLVPYTGETEIAELAARAQAEGGTRTAAVATPAGRMLVAAAPVQAPGAAGDAVFVLVRQGAVVRWQPLRLPGLLAAGVAILLSLVLANWLSRRLARPLSEVSAAAEAVARGDFDRRVPVGGDGEMADLARSFNDMAGGLAAARAREQAFLMSVSHDLKTPLTSIGGFAEALADEAVPVADIPRAGAVILRESRRLERLVSDLLDLARLDAGGFSLRPDDVELGAVLREVVEVYARKAAEADLTLHHDIIDLSIHTDADRVVQIVANLLENALRYVPPGSRIWLECAPLPGGGAEVRVRDDGTGIHPDDLPHVFERLYVSSRYTPRRQQGSGLGLAIVAELAAALGGTIAVMSTPGSGTTFTLRLPA